MYTYLNIPQKLKIHPHHKPLPGNGSLLDSAEKVMPLGVSLLLLLLQKGWRGGRSEHRASFSSLLLESETGFRSPDFSSWRGGLEALCPQILSERMPKACIGEGRVQKVCRLWAKSLSNEFPIRFSPVPGKCRDPKHCFQYESSFLPGRAFSFYEACEKKNQRQHCVLQHCHQLCASTRLSFRVWHPHHYKAIVTTLF